MTDDKTIDRHRGHVVSESAPNVWVYADTQELVSKNPERPCGHCKLPNRSTGHDACIGTLPKVMNACCGHGGSREAYVQYWDYSRVAGAEAMSIFEQHRKGLMIDTTLQFEAGPEPSSPLPWRHGEPDYDPDEDGPPDDPGAITFSPPDKPDYYIDFVAEEATAEDAAAIVHRVNNYPALLAAHNKLQQQAAAAAAYVRDRCEQWRPDNAIYDVLSTIAFNLERGEHLAAHAHGELDDLIAVAEENNKRLDDAENGG